MRITLISPRIAVQKGDFLGSGVPYWPVEMAVLAAFLRDKGNKISVIDLFGSSPTTLEEKGDHYLQGQIIHHYLKSPAVINAEIFILYAISSMSHRELISIASVIRKSRPEAMVAILENSQAVTAYAISEVSNDFFSCGVDALLCGEIYWNWDEIGPFLQNPIEVTVPENVFVSNLPPEHKLRRKIEKYPSYPIPYWELFNLKGYWSIPYSHGPKTKRFLPILTSRGCPYPCDFCVVPETNNVRWRGRAPEEVVNEMMTLKDRFGVRDFQIEDLNPTVNGLRWEEICKLLIQRNAEIFFYFVSGTKSETVKIDRVPLYAQAGCRYISISPESGSPRILKIMGKPFNHVHALSLIESCHRNGIYTQACLLVGHPVEKDEDHRLSCDYLRSMVRAGLDEVAVFIVAPLAGSVLHNENSIDLSSTEALTSFSPKGRTGWDIFARRRSELLRIFFLEKLKRGPAIWFQGIRALLGIPRTKMENLPRRIIFIYWILLKYKLQRMLTHRRSLTGI